MSPRTVLSQSVVAAIVLLSGHPGRAADHWYDSPEKIPVPRPGQLPPRGITPVSLQPKPKLKSGNRPKFNDSIYVRKPIGQVTLDDITPDFEKIDARPAKKVPTEPSPMWGKYTTDPYASTQTQWLHNPDGGWYDNSLRGPVSPFCYLPTYFEDRSIERFGWTRHDCIQPFFSSAEFLVRVPLLPYLMTVDPPCRHRPPNYCPPPQGIVDSAGHYARNISPAGAGIESVAVIGLFLLIP